VIYDIRKTATRAMLVALLFGAPTAHAADLYDHEYAQCREGTTVSIVQCVDRLTETWQARLDQAYQTLLARQSSSERKAALEEAQRLWRAYRHASCAFYRQGPGSITAIEAAECRRVLTSRRARELEQAAGVEPR
jgi:uncharacterized protein YecT (DUF1311 family)